jgi:hypothetical protein
MNTAIMGTAIMIIIIIDQLDCCIFNILKKLFCNIFINDFRNWQPKVSQILTDNISFANLRPITRLTFIKNKGCA